MLRRSSLAARRLGAAGRYESFASKILHLTSLLVFLAGGGGAYAQECSNEGASQSAPVRQLYVIAGQSNAAGLATVNDFVSGKHDVVDKNTSYKNVSIYGIYGAPAGVTGGDEGIGPKRVDWSRYANWHKASPGFGYKIGPGDLRMFPFGSKPVDFFGPELSLAGMLNNRPPHDHYIVKLAVANTALYPNGSINHWHPSGALYAQLLQMISDAHNSKTGAVRLKVAGMFFMQGETDALHEVWAKAYRDNILNFIERFRADVRRMGCSDILDFPVVIGRIQNNGAWTYREYVRSAQGRVPENLNNVAVIDTDDFSHHLVAGGVHFDEYAQFQLGKRVYWAFEKLSSSFGGYCHAAQAEIAQRHVRPTAERACKSYYGQARERSLALLQNALPLTYRYDGVCHTRPCAAPWGRSN